MSLRNEAHSRRKTLIAGRLPALLAADSALAQRFHAVRHFSALVRACEYHVTNACNIRCKGCWFFEFGHDAHAAENKDIDAWRAFAGAQR